MTNSFSKIAETFRDWCSHHFESKYVNHFSKKFLVKSIRRPLVHSANIKLTFDSLPNVQIECVIACWKSCQVYFPEHLEFCNLEFIFPIKIQISQEWYKCAYWGYPKCRVLLQSNFEGLLQLQIELMIAHWKPICVYLSVNASIK